MPDRLAIVHLMLLAALTGCQPATAPTTASVAAVDGAAPDRSSTDAGAFLPCDVEAALKAKCQTCHTMPMRNGATFPLLDYADTQMEYASMKTWQVMKNALDTQFMPPASSPTGPLTTTEKTALLSWLSAGAPPAPQRCTPGN